MKATLFYIHDPMCSWCWGFSDTLKALINHLPANIQFKRILGGLAPDTDEPMPDYLVSTVQNSWRRIEETIPGKEFNFDFWEKANPRRSTYPACRAVVAARKQGSDYDEKMTAAIQTAYYQQARNPSDMEVLVSLAEELGLDKDKFTEDMNSETVEREFMQEVNLAQEMFVESYPSFVLKIDEELHTIPIDYLSYENIMAEINKYLV
jgi:putative protein-disulfide isomerase